LTPLTPPRVKAYGCVTAGRVGPGARRARPGPRLRVSEQNVQRFGASVRRWGNHNMQPGAAALLQITSWTPHIDVDRVATGLTPTPTAPRHGGALSGLPPAAGKPSGLPPLLPGLGRGAPPDQEACACWDGVGAGSQPAPGDGRATLSGGPRRAVKSPGPKAGLMSDSEQRVGARASRRKDASTPLTRGFD